MINDARGKVVFAIVCLTFIASGINLHNNVSFTLIDSGPPSLLIDNINNTIGTISDLNIVPSNDEGRGSDRSDLIVTNDTNPNKPSPLTATAMTAATTSVSGGLSSLPHGKVSGNEIHTNYAPNQTLIQLWSGEATRPFVKISQLSRDDNDVSGISIAKIKTIVLVIAYCSANLKWIYDDVLQQISKEREITVRMTILSKCGKEADLPQFINNPLVTDVDLIKLPNVGGCDYAYAHFINIYISNAKPSEANSSLILFMKDTRRKMDQDIYRTFAYHSRHRNVTEMIAIASRGEFICGAKFQCNVSPFHNTDKVNKFQIQEYVRTTDKKKGIEAKRTSDFNANRYANVGDFHRRALDWKFPNKNLTEVCYGGVFAVPASRILFLSNQPKERLALKLIEKNLTRNTTLALEEHFTERTWAGLLAQTLNEEDVALIHGMAPGKPNFLTGRKAVAGALVGNKNLTCS